MPSDLPAAPGEPHIDPFVNSVWCLIFSMIERGVDGSEPWWGQDFLMVKRALEELGLNCDPNAVTLDVDAPPDLRRTGESDTQ